MNNPIYFYYYLLLWLVISSCSKQNIQKGDSLAAFSTHLDHKIPQLMDHYDVPGLTLALIREESIAWSAAYGYADIERNRKMSVNAVFRAESISKSVTAWGVMKLAEEGLIDLDAPVEKYLKSWELPQSNYSTKEVTVRRLLSNNSGLPLGTMSQEYSPESPMPSLKEYLTQDVKLSRPPGTDFEYSNVGFNLLELLIEEVTGCNFNDYMTAEILRPLHMYHSSFVWNKNWATAVPTGYDLNGNPVPPYVYAGKASGGLFATVEDIARFVSAGMGPKINTPNPVLKTETLSKIYIPQISVAGLFGLVADSYGFGHFIETLPSSHKALWHGGQGHGWMTHFHSIPETGDGIVIFTNSQRSWPLIAHILNDWSDWNRLTGIKFGRIVKASSVLWAVTSGLLLLALLKGWQIGKDLLRHKRRFTLSLRIQTFKRLTELLAGISVIVALLWAVTQPYLFFYSIFPTNTPWLGWGLLLFSVVIFMDAFFPATAKTIRQNSQISI